MQSMPALHDEEDKNEVSREITLSGDRIGYCNMIFSRLSLQK